MQKNFPTDFTLKPAPVDADLLIIADSEDNNEMKEITLGSMTASIADGVINDGASNLTQTYSSDKINELDDVVQAIAETDASASIKGRTRLSTAPVSATVPIAVGDNDTRVSPVSLASLTEGRVAATAGTSGTPSDTNRYVTDDDTVGTGSIARLSVIPNANYGDGSDGNVVIASGTTTITRDMFYNDLTIQTGGILATAGFRVFVKGTLTYQGTGKLQCNGGNGGAGANGGVGATNATGGTPGVAAITAGSLPPTLAGTTGGVGATAASAQAGGNGTNGTAVAKSLGTAGAAGGVGSTGGTAGSGTGPGVGGTAGTGGTQSGTVFNKLNSIQSGYYLIDNQPTIVTLTGSGGAGSGGGGGGGRSSNAADCGAGGAGGGGGAAGGIIFLAAASIVTVDGNVFAEALGGNGGNGGNGGTSTGNNGGGGSGGGGGAGGTGGVVIVYYSSKTGTGIISVTGGTPGAGGGLGTAHGTGTNGTAGAAGTVGNSGTTYQIQI